MAICCCGSPMRRAKSASCGGARPHERPTPAKLLNRSALSNGMNGSQADDPRWSRGSIGRAAGGRTRSRRFAAPAGAPLLRASAPPSAHRRLRARTAAPCSLHLCRAATAAIVGFFSELALWLGRGTACARTRRIPGPALPATCDRGRARTG
jgi:hypothetical protein